nr:hypothetical protein [Tanacetum cinerariifolium]
RITRGTIRISQSKVPSPGADETAFPLGDVRYGEAFPTDTSLDACQDRENIVKTSAMPHEALPRVTSLGDGEGKEKRRTCSGGCSKHGMDGSRGGFISWRYCEDSDKSADKGSDNTDEMSQVLGVENILASRGLRSVFTTASLSVAIASIDISPIVATASGELDRSNEMVAKYLSEYEQAVVGLSHNEKVELINELPMYQRHLTQIKKYQAQQNKPATKTERRNFYMSILRSNAGQRKCWKIIRVGNHTEVYQLFNDMIKKFDREDLDKLWSLVKKTCSTTEVIDEKAKELWVELKKLYEPNSRDPLWAL